MALRPRYNPQSAGRASPAPYLPANFGQSQGLQQLGAALAEVGTQLQARQDKEDALWAQEKFNEFQAEWSSSSVTRSNQALAAPTEFSRFDEEERLRYREATTEFLGRIDGERRLPRDVRRALQGQLSTYGLKAAAVAQQTEQSRNSLATKSLLQSRLDLLTNETITDPSGWQAREQTLMQLLAANRDAVGEDAVPLARSIKNTIRSAHVTGLIEQDPNGTLKALEDGKFDDMLTPDTRVKLTSVAEREVEKRQRAAEAFRANRVKLANQYIKQAENDLALGLPVSVDNVRMLAQEVGGTEGEILASQAQNLDAQAKLWSGMSMLPKAERQRVINEGYVAAQKGQLGPAQKETLLNMEKLNSRMNWMAEEDLAGTAVRMGITDAPAPISLQNMEEVEIALTRNASLVKQVFGPDAEFVSNEVRAEIEDTLKTGTAAARFNLFQSVQQYDGLRSMVGRMANAENPAFGVAFRLVEEDPALANRVLSGLTVLENLPELEPTQRDVILGLENEMGGAFAMSPAHQRGVMDATVALYAQQQGGKLPAIVEPSDLREAFEQVTGGVIRFNGSRIPAPVPGQSASEFRDMLRGMPEEAWSGKDDQPVAFVFDPAVGGEIPTDGPIKLPTGEDLTWEILEDEAQLLFTGDGGYWVMLNGGKVVDARQRPLVLRFPRRAR